MEFIRERTSPLPSKNQTHTSEAKVIKMLNLGNVCKETIASPKGLETASVEISESSHHQEKNNLFGPQRFFLKQPEVSKTYKTNPNLKFWSDNKSELSSEEIYENIFFDGMSNRSKQAGKKEKSFYNEKEERRKTPEIEVRQEDNKTVVKISIKEEITSPVQNLEEKRVLDENKNIYENGYIDRNGFNFIVNSDVVSIENIENSEIELGQLYENLPEIGSEEAVVNECLYENLGNKKRYSEAESITKANHGKMSEGDLKCNQVYENDFKFEKTKTRKIKNSIKHGERNDDSYEIIENNCLLHYDDNPFGNGQKSVTVERRKLDNADAVKKSSFADLKLLKSNSITDYNCSCDALDSGTCSDVDSLPFANMKKGIAGAMTKTLHCDEVKKNEPGHRRAESFTSSGVGIDSEESDDENSNISCDSLNSNDPYLQSNSEDNGYHTPNPEDKTESPVESVNYENMIKISRDDSKEENETNFNLKEMEKEEKYFFVSDFEEYENVNVFIEKPISSIKSTLPPPPPPPPCNLQKLEQKTDSSISSKNVRLSSTYPNGKSHQKINSTVTQAINNLNEKSSSKRRLVEEKTYEERKSSVKSVKLNKICAMEVDTDQFYKFHLAEKSMDGKDNEEETFAGIKDYLSREKPAAITSAKGTIRGVKNRVKAGIATFLQMHENKSYKDRDAGKVVVYTTTMGIVRETYHKCLKVKQILKTLMVKFEERDVFMSSEAQQEIRDRMKCNVILVPQVFVEGQHIGDAETIERLNEIGELRIILKPYKSIDACSTCNVCGGYRLLPCRVCKGSKKSIHRNHFTMEFVSLKCMNCDQVGLTKCNAC